MKKYLSDEEFEKISATFYDNFNEYLIIYVLPDVVAFYLANSHYRNCLAESPLENHINSVQSIINIKCNITELITSIKEVLRIKYNLKIIQINPLKLEKTY